MKVTLESTSRIITINGVPARIWEGRTAGGVPCFAAITRIAAHKNDDNSEFERELVEHKAPSAEAVSVFDLRTVI